MGIYPRHEREAELDHLMYVHAGTRPGDRERRDHDPMFNLQTEILRDVLKRADKAMEDEGVGTGTRDRVVHRIVFCEAQEGTRDRLERWEDPDARLWVRLPPGDQVLADVTGDGEA